METVFALPVLCDENHWSRVDSPHKEVTYHTYAKHTVKQTLESSVILDASMLIVMLL